MTVQKKKISPFFHFLYRLVLPFFDPLKLFYTTRGYFDFLKDLFIYSRMKDAETIPILDINPIIGDKTETSPFDAHYFYQDIWAFKKVLKSKVKQHVDIGSRIDFVGFLSTITKVIFVDIRPLEANLENFQSKKGDILSLPFRDNSIRSLSCLHVAEHIGLGRYGDKLDPLGTKKACKELSRVLTKGGNLYFSLPVGKPKICFNAHRIHSPKQIVDYFSGLELVEFSGIDDDKKLRENIDMQELENSQYACGLFWFRKK